MATTIIEKAKLLNSLLLYKKAFNTFEAVNKEKTSTPELTSVKNFCLCDAGFKKIEIEKVDYSIESLKNSLPIWAVELAELNSKHDIPNMEWTEEFLQELKEGAKTYL